MKKVSLLLALVMLMSCLAGMGSAMAQEEPTTVSFMTTEFINAPLTNDSPTIKALEAALNIKLDLRMVGSSQPGDYLEKFNIMLASGDYPDIVRGDNGSGSIADQYLNTGIFQDLTEVMPTKMPNVYAELQKHGLLKDATSDDGKLWFVPKIEDSTRISEIDWINQDWLDKLGLSVPTTTDELYEVLKAFKAGMDPDCIPMSIGPWGDKLWSMYCAFGTWYEWRMFNEADGMQYGPYDKAEEMRACLAFLSKLYAEGLLDQEYMTRDDDSINALLANGKLGYFFGWTDDAARVQKGGSLGVNYTYMLPIAGPNGTRGWAKDTKMSLRYYVTANSKVKDKAYELIDYIFSEEGRTLFTWGIEGETFNVVDGVKQYSDEIANWPSGPLDGRRQKGINPPSFLHVSEWEGWAESLPELCMEIADATAPYALPIQPALSGTPEEEMELANLMQDIKKYVDGQLPLFVTGALNTEGDFDAFIAQLEKMNIARAKEIKNAQFVRWQNRK